MPEEIYNISLSSIEVTQVRVAIGVFIKDCREHYQGCVGKLELSDIGDFWLAEIRQYEALLKRFQIIKPLEDMK